MARLRTLGLADSFFGVIAMKNRLLTRDQLAETVRIQWERAQGGVGPRLGEICVTLGYLTEKNVAAILTAQKESRLLLKETLCGQIAVKNGFISDKQLQGALDEQRRRGPGARLGHILIERDDLTSQQTHAILVSQKRMKSSPYLILPDEEEPQVRSLRTARLARSRAVTASASPLTMRRAARVAVARGKPAVDRKVAAKKSAVPKKAAPKKAAPKKTAPKKSAVPKKAAPKKSAVPKKAAPKRSKRKR